MSAYAELRMRAELFNDAQAARVSAENKVRSGTVSPELFASHLDSLGSIEHQCELDLWKVYRATVPAGVLAWQKSTLGIGQHLLSRLLGQLGDPVIATPQYWEGTGSNRVLVEGEPFERTVSELWSYAGHGDPARRLYKGITADDLAALGNPKAKMLTHLLAEAAVKAGIRALPGDGEKGVPGTATRKAISPLGLLYLELRDGAAEKVHATACVRCGPSGKPAQPGSPWSLAHQHAHALRVVGKAILRDLWRTAQGLDALHGGAL